MLKKQSKNAKITLSILFIFIGLCLISFNYFDSIKNDVFNEKNIRLLEQTIVINEELKEIDEEEVIEPIIEEPVIEESEVEVDVDEYIGYLTIDKINLKRGFLSTKSKYNTVHYNVTQIEGSTMPDQKNGNLILASHSGSSSISYFKHLHKLELGDTAEVFYKNKTYKYKLVNIYTEPKDGSLTIKRDGDKSVLTLITCTKNDKKTQSIFIFELQEK